MQLIYNKTYSAKVLKNQKINPHVKLYLKFLFQVKTQKSLNFYDTYFNAYKNKAKGKMQTIFAILY